MWPHHSPLSLFIALQDSSGPLASLSLGATVSSEDAKGAHLLSSPDPPTPPVCPTGLCSPASPPVLPVLPDLAKAPPLDVSPAFVSGKYAHSQVLTQHFLFLLLNYS